MGVRRNFSKWGQRRHFACPFQVADDAMQIDVHKTLFPFYTIKKMPYVTVKVIKLRFVDAAILHLHSCFFSHRIKLRGLPLSAQCCHFSWFAAKSGTVFLTMGFASPGDTNKFPGRHEPLRALQHGKFDQVNLPIITFVFTTYLKSGRLETSDNY